MRSRAIRLHSPTEDRLERYPPTTSVMASSQNLVKKVSDYVEEYMRHFDGSHDFNHIMRVLGLSHQIYSQLDKSQKETGIATSQPLDLEVITLSALLHVIKPIYLSYLRLHNSRRSQKRSAGRENMMLIHW